MRKISLIVLLITVTCVFASSLWAAQSDLAKADWSVKAPHSLKDNPPSKDAVWSFIGHLPGRFADGGKLCDFRFVDLRRQGTLSLVVSDDAGGTSDCSEVEVFDKVADSFEEYYESGYLETPGIEDINGDGRFEVVVGEPHGVEYQQDNQGSGIEYCDACRVCTEIWPRVYAWTGSGYTEVSSRYPKYYQRELASLKKEIAAIDASEAAARLSPTAAPTTTVPFASAVAVLSTTEDGVSLAPPETRTEPSAAESPTPGAAATPYPGGIDCLKAEAAKMERYLGVSQDAGMRDTIRWANSSDPAEREWATGVLPDIGTAEALEYERTLSRDSDPNVASSAKSEIKDWGKPQSAQPSSFQRSTDQE